MTEEHDILIRRAAFGKQVEMFFNSDIGKYLLARSDSDIADAFNAMKVCDPKDGKMVQHYQNQIWRAESIRNWLEDCVVDGLNAINILDDPD